MSNKSISYKSLKVRQETDYPVSPFLALLRIRPKVFSYKGFVSRQTLSALLFLYRYVLHQPSPQLEGIERAKRPHRVPTVLTRQEVQMVLSTLSGMPFLMASLLYGAGLRLMEGGRLRAKNP